MLLARFGISLALIGSLAQVPSAAIGAVNDPVVGSSTLVSADPGVPVPTSAQVGNPCIYDLAPISVDGPGLSYSIYSVNSCWIGYAKIVLKLDIGVDNAKDPNSPPIPLSLWVNGVNIFLGDLAITSSNTGVKPCGAMYCEHIERDLTDYAALLVNNSTNPSVTVTTLAGLGNEVGTSNNTKVIGKAQLWLYPDKDVSGVALPFPGVYPLGASIYYDGTYNAGVLANLRSPADQLSLTVNAPGNVYLPHNIERAYLDVNLRPATYTYVAINAHQGELQPNDPWYSCLPQQYASAYPSLILDAQHNFTSHCIGGSFREAEVFIDDQPAGVVPLYPAYPIQSLSDAQLWLPSMQPQEQSYLPSRVDLSPFASVLSDGAPHTISLHVASNSDAATSNNPVAGVWATATLLTYLDPLVTQVTGAITRNDLVNQPPAPVVVGSLSNTQGSLSGSVVTSSERHYVIDGYTHIYSGVLRTRVERTASFVDTQTFSLPATTAPRLIYQKSISLVSNDNGDTRTYLNGPLVGEYLTNRGYPLASSYYLWHDPTEDHEVKRIGQDFLQQLIRSEGGTTAYSSITQNYVRGAVDTLTGLAPYRVFKQLNAQGGWQTFNFNDSLGSCYSTTLTTKDSVLASWETGTGCPNQQNSLQWQSHPDGSPDSLSWVNYP